MELYNAIIKEAKKNVPSGSEQKIKVVLGGNCNTDYLLKPLQYFLGRESYAATCESYGFNNWQLESLQDESPQDCVVLWLSALGASQGGVCEPHYDIDSIVNSTNKLLRDGKIAVVILPETVEHAESPYAPLYDSYQALKRQLIEALSQQVITIDPDFLKGECIETGWYSLKYWMLAKLPLHPNALIPLCRYLAALIRAAIKPRVKAIVVDLDNTLWGGVIGESDFNQIALDPFGDGLPFLQLQRWLKSIQKDGIPLCVVSKNNHDDAVQPFKQRKEDLILGLDDFVYFYANWQSKHLNIRKIATDLQIGVDSICFLDDSIHEREEARHFLPDLIVPELSCDPAERVPQLSSSYLFLKPKRQAEDRERVNFYKTQKDRIELAERTSSVQEYLENLKMVLSAKEVCDSNIERIAELTNKTNQFNLRTARFTVNEIKHYVNVNSGIVFCYQLEDRFGQAGIVGVIMAHPEGQTLFIENFLLSCRAINRHVEIAMLNHFIDYAQCNNFSEVKAEYIKSKKNNLVSSFYSNTGFTEDTTTEQKRNYSALVSKLPRKESYIKMSAVESKLTQKEPENVS